MTRRRPAVLAFYSIVGFLGAAAFLYPFWIPSEGLPNAAHGADAPLSAGLVAAMLIAAIAVEVRERTMNGATIAVLGVLSATAGLARMIDLPGGGSGIFFLVVLAGAAFGPRFGFLLGLGSMAVSALLTGGIGPWLPFQMLALSWMGAGAGFVGALTRRMSTYFEVSVLAAYGWTWGFIYGAVMNLWFWPYVRDGGPLSWHPGMGLVETLSHYWSFYVVTSLAWDAAGATANALLILLTGSAIMRTLRRYSARLAPVVTIVDSDTGGLPLGNNVGGRAYRQTAADL